MRAWKVVRGKLIELTLFLLGCMGFHDCNTHFFSFQTFNFELTVTFYHINFSVP